MDHRRGSQTASSSLPVMTQDNEAYRPDYAPRNCWDDRTSEPIAHGIGLLPVYMYDSILMQIHMYGLISLNMYI